jgi:peptidoglycan/LPS O-acetylase OafA/YrhL
MLAPMRRRTDEKIVGPMMANEPDSPASQSGLNVLRHILDAYGGVQRSYKARTARVLAAAGLASIVIAVVISLTTDGSVGWAWDAMMLASLLGVALIALAAWINLRKWRDEHAAPQ